MKKTILFLFFIGQITLTLAQTKVKITADLGVGNQTMEIQNGDEISVPANLPGLTSFGLQFSTLPATNKLIIKVQNTNIAAGSSNEYTNAEVASSKNFAFQSGIINKQITIVNHTIPTGAETDLLSFKFIQSAAVNNPVHTNNTGGNVQIEPLADYLDRTSANYRSTPQGWIISETSGLSLEEKRKQVNITHIFFDEFGNSLLGAIPQGISNRQYVVHIIYRGYANKQRDVRYSIKQKSGSFSSALNINNSGILKSLPAGLQGREEDDPFDTWKEEIFPLGIATDDLSFEITATTVDNNNKPVKVVLETQTIKMSPVFHASMDVGLINSELKNSAFSLVDAPDGSANKVLRETDRSPKGIVTIMATFYTSPIVIIEKLFEKRLKKQIPNYKLSGRSYFDDHSFFERIYPTVGVSVSSKSFENLFFGLNWELARGLSVFGGAHWGKVNTFEMLNITTGVTPVTQQQFDFYQNTKWKIDWAYGAKLDITIVTNLFK